MLAPHCPPRRDVLLSRYGLKARNCAQFSSNATRCEQYRVGSHPCVAKGNVCEQSQNSYYRVHNTSFFCAFSLDVAVYFDGDKSTAAHMMSDPFNRLMFCTIPKCASTLIRRMSIDLDAPTRQRIGRSPGLAPDFSPAYALASSRWYKLLVVRDPIDRFASAYRSKCEVQLDGSDGRDADGAQHCRKLLRIPQADMSALRVIEELERARRKGYTPATRNPHWLEQRLFCGGVEHSYRYYNYRVAFERLREGLTRLLDSLDNATHGNTVNLDVAAARATILKETSPRHITNATGARSWLDEKTTEKVAAYYARDIAFVERVLQ